MTDKKDLKRHIRARQAKTGEAYTTARVHVLRGRAAGDSGEVITGHVLKRGPQSIRVRIPGEDAAITLRCSGYDAMRAFPGQCVRATLTKRWDWRGDPYASGSVDRVWTDVPALGLVPLKLADHGVDDLSSCEPFVPPDPYAEMWERFASTPRREYEFERIAWEPEEDPGDSGDFFDDGIVLRAIHERDARKAQNILMQGLVRDLRFIDAHAHLGNLAFDRCPEDALVHYRIGVAIGDLSLGPRFEGMLPWGRIFNRPFLRALHGLGLCLWRLEQTEEALGVFTRLLALNPRDNQGVRFCWDDIREGRPWVGEVGATG